MQNSMICLIKIKFKNIEQVNNMEITAYSQPTQNNLESYIPLPLEQIFKAGQAIQTRGDAAQAQNDQYQTGLASIETQASGQRSYVNNLVNNYKTQQGALLDKYNGNTSDLDYERESRRINMQVAADPNLKVIQNTNEAYKAKEKAKNDLDEKGIKYIDTRPNFTGKDANGNLTSDVGNIQATDFDNQIDNSFKEQEGSMEEHNGVRSNRMPIQRNVHGYLESWNTNPLIQKGLQWYKQQGLSDDAAKLAVLNHINQSASKYTRDDKDHFYETMAWDKYKFGIEQKEKRDALAARTTKSPVPPFSSQTYAAPVTPGQDPTDITNPHSVSYNNTKRAIDNLTSDGNLDNSYRTVEDTPENRKAFGKNATPTVVTTGAGGSGSFPTSVKALKVSNYNPDELKLLNTVRKLMNIGSGRGNAKDLFTRYLDLQDATDQNANTGRQTDNTAINNAIANTVISQIGTSEIYRKDGQILNKVTDPKELTTFEDLTPKNIGGMSPKSIPTSDGSTLTGYTIFSKDGKKYYVPLSKEYQQQYRGSNAVDNYLHDFNDKNMQETKIPVKQGDKTIAKKVFINPNDHGQDYIYDGHLGTLSPYKAYIDGEMKGGAIFTSTYKEGDIDIPKGAKVGDPYHQYMTDSALEEQEHKSIGVKVANNNGITGN